MAVLLELAAADDVVGFRRAVEGDKAPALDDAGHWYGPSAAAAGRLRLRLEARTPAMVAALYGSTAVLAYVLSAAPAEAARASPTDGATPLHLAAASGAPCSQFARVQIERAPSKSSGRPRREQSSKTRW